MMPGGQASCIAALRVERLLLRCAFRLLIVECTLRRQEDRCPARRFPDVIVEPPGLAAALSAHRAVAGLVDDRGGWSRTAC